MPANTIKPLSRSGGFFLFVGTNILIDEHAKKVESKKSFCLAGEEEEDIWQNPLNRGSLREKKN